MEMEGQEVGTYTSFVGRVERASSELREIEGAGDNFMMDCDEMGNNIMNSSSDESYYDVDILDFDETRFIATPKPDPSEKVDITTLVIPPEEIQGSLKHTEVNSRPLRKFQVEKENGQFLCPICGHPFKWSNNAVRHTYTHMNQLELQKVNIYHQRCPHSPTRIFFDRRDYTNHINSHEGIKNFKCQICKKGFIGKRNLHYHMLTHVNQGSEEVQTPLNFRYFQCYFCHKKFGNMSSLIIHLGVHTKETPFKCAYCNKWLKSESSMKYHIDHVHSHPDNPKLFPCPHCPKAWNERGRLTEHIKVVHREKVHKCPKCSKSFSKKSVLDRHVDMIHNKIRHQCPQCSKSFSSKQGLNIHVASVHNKIRNHCPQCDKTFSNKSHVFRHIKKNHR